MGVNRILGIIFVFGLFVLVGLALSKSIRDFLVGTIGSILGSIGVNSSLYDFSPFVDYLLTNIFGWVWLFSMFLLISIMLYNLVVYGEAIR